MSLNRLKNAVIEMAVFAIALGSIESAKAGFAIRTPRVINNSPRIEIEINNSIQDNLRNDLKQGKFIEAVTVKYFVGPDKVFSLTGDLKSSLVEDSEVIANIATDLNKSSFGDEFKRIGKAVKYESKLIDENPLGEYEFEFFAPFDNPNSLLLLSGSNLTQFLNRELRVTFPGKLESFASVTSREQYLDFFFVEEEPKLIPESSSVFSILALGCFACASQVRRLISKTRKFS